MEKTLNINRLVAKKIADKMFMTYSDLSGNCFGCMGTIDVSSGNIDITSFESGASALIKEVENYLISAETKIKPGSPILISGTPHSISGIKMDGSDVVFCFSSPFGSPYDMAVIVVYAHYHNLKQKNHIEDDLFSDTLLLHVGRWQEQYAHDNEFIVPLAREIFKPESIIV